MGCGASVDDDAGKLQVATCGQCHERRQIVRFTRDELALCTTCWKQHGATKATNPILLKCTVCGERRHLANQGRCAACWLVAAPSAADKAQSLRAGQSPLNGYEVRDEYPRRGSGLMRSATRELQRTLSSSFSLGLRGRLTSRSKGSRTSTASPGSRALSSSSASTRAASAWLRASPGQSIRRHHTLGAVSPSPRDMHVQDTTPSKGTGDVYALPRSQPPSRKSSSEPHLASHEQSRKSSSQTSSSESDDEVGEGQKQVNPRPSSALLRSAPVQSVRRPSARGVYELSPHTVYKPGVTRSLPRLINLEKNSPSEPLWAGHLQRRKNYSQTSASELPGSILS